MIKKIMDRSFMWKISIVQKLLGSCGHCNFFSNYQLQKWSLKNKKKFFKKFVDDVISQQFRKMVSKPKKIEIGSSENIHYNRKSFLLL